MSSSRKSRSHPSPVADQSMPVHNESAQVGQRQMETASHHLDLNKGDHVSYHAIGKSGKVATGEVIDIVTTATSLKGHHFLGTEDQPYVIIKNDHTGKKWGYHTERIEGVVSEGEGPDQGHTQSGDPAIAGVADVE